MNFNAKAQGRKGGCGMILKAWRGVGIGIILPLCAVLALLLVALTALDARADGGTTSFAGRGSATYEVTNPEDCAETGICKGELRGDFIAAGSDLSAAGDVIFNFVDDRSRASSQSGACSAAAPGAHTFVWTAGEGNRLIMSQTLGFMCPSDNGEAGYWKRFLRIDSGSGRFDGATGSVFISGTTAFETGATNWTFSGKITAPAEPRQGCYRAYFIGSAILIPPRDAPAPPYADFLVWLCGDDFSLIGPNAREGYEIFNPLAEP